MKLEIVTVSVFLLRKNEAIVDVNSTEHGLSRFSLRTARNSTSQPPQLFRSELYRNKWNPILLLISCCFPTLIDLTLFSGLFASPWPGWWNHRCICIVVRVGNRHLCIHSSLPFLEFTF